MPATRHARPLHGGHRRRAPTPGRHAQALLVAVSAAAAIAVAPGTDTPVDPPLGGVADVVGAPQPSPSTAPDGDRVAVAPLARPDPRLEPIVPTPAPPETLRGYRWPLPNGRLTLPFGPSRLGSRIVDGQLFHDGIDLATFCGDRVVAAHDGIVLAAGRRYDWYMGWKGDLAPYLARLDAKALWGTLPIVVVVDDGNGYRSIYAHFSRIVVQAGDAVEVGQLLGYEGATGRATGCHLHYGMFSPLESHTFTIDPAVVGRMLVPAYQIARIDPLRVLPWRPDPHATPTPPRGGQ